MGSVAMISCLCCGRRHPIGYDCTDDPEYEDPREVDDEEGYEGKRRG